MSVDRQLILDCKNTFSPDCGLRLLAHLEIFCGGHVNQENFDLNSERKTAYNLGKNRVFRHIRSMIDCDLGKSEQKDCVLEIQDTD